MRLTKHLFGVLLLLSPLPRLLHADQTTATEIANQVDAFRSLGEKNLPLYLTVLVETFWSSPKFRDEYTRTTSSQVYNPSGYLPSRAGTDRSWNYYLKCLRFLESNSETTLSSMNTIIEQANGNKEFEATEDDELEEELNLPIKVPSSWKKGAFLKSWTLLKSVNMDLERLTTRQVLNSIVDDYLSWTSKWAIQTLGKEEVYRRQAELLLLLRPRFKALHQLQTSLNLDMAPLKDPKLGGGCPFSQYIQTISNTLRTLDDSIEYSFISPDFFKAFMAPFPLAITEGSPVSLSDLEYNGHLIREYIKPDENIDIPEWAAPLLPVTVSELAEPLAVSFSELQHEGSFTSKILYRDLVDDLLFNYFDRYAQNKDKYRVSYRTMHRMQALWCIAILPKWKKIHQKLGKISIQEEVSPDLKKLIAEQLGPKLTQIALTNYGKFVRILFHSLLCTPRFRELFEEFPQKTFETTLDFLRRTLQILMPNLRWPELAQTPTDVYIKEIKGVMSSNNLKKEIMNLVTTESEAHDEAALKWEEDWEPIAESFKWRYSVAFDRSFADHFLEQLWSTSPGQCITPRPVRLLARLLVSFLPLYETAIEKAILPNDLKGPIKEPENNQKHIREPEKPQPDYKKWHQKWQVWVGAVAAAVAAAYFDVPGRISRFLTGSSLANETTASSNSTVAPLPFYRIILVLSVSLLLILLALLLYTNPFSGAGQSKDPKSKVQTKETKKQKKRKRNIQKQTNPSSTPVSEVLKPLKAPRKPLKAQRKPLKVSNKPLKASGAAPRRALPPKPSVSSTISTTISVQSHQGRSTFQSSTISSPAKK